MQEHNHRTIMKKSKLLPVMSIILMLGIPFSSEAKMKDTPKAKTEVPTEVQVMLDRLEEIKAMDKSELSRSEKKVLRAEVKELNAEIKEVGGGIYLSAGAIIIILLLIILL